MPKMSHIEITRLQGGLAIGSFVSGIALKKKHTLGINLTKEVKDHAGKTRRL